MKKTLLTLVTATLLLTGSTTLLSANASDKTAKPFLIQGKLPHLTMMVKILWDDEDLALTKIQKEKLLKIRKHTLKTAKSLKQQIIQLENKIVQQSTEGINPSILKKSVEKLALLRANATMVHLYCIYNTRATLSKEQLSILE